MSITTHRIPGLILIDHEFRVPLDYARPQDARITVFAREVVAPGKEHADLPWLVFFQGGPGHKSPRPAESSDWLKRALQEYRVLLLDQRGTGRSTPVNHQTLAKLESPQAQADYLKSFRADSIVRDAEHIRKVLLGPDRRWSVLGQSYGGFCVLHYLSAAPDSLREAFITGGLPPVDRSADDIYRATYRRVMEQNRRYFARYPDDQVRACEVMEYLASHDVRLPNGDPLTPRRFQQLGLWFGASNGFEWVHYLLEEAFVDGRSGRELSDTFLYTVQKEVSFATHPIFAILHESIYCQQSASGWAAERIRGEYPEYNWSPGRPVYFTGEMIYPWMFDEDGSLRPLKQAAEILAAFQNWPRLYDVNRLRSNNVPSAAVIYYDDMYVERQFSEETAQLVQGMRVWVTNELMHNGLRAEGELVMGRLLDLLHGER